MLLNPLPKRVLVYGLGQEGQAAQAFFSQRKISVETYDDANDQTPPNWKDFDLIIRSPGVPPTQIPPEFWPCVKTGTQLFFSALGESKFRSKVIGITGSKGKTTTTKFVAETLERAGFSVKIGGNYGQPLLSLWDDFFGNKYDFLVVELSSFQLELGLENAPQYALFLGMAGDHQDRHPTPTVYWEAKSELWKNQKSSDFLGVPAIVRENMPTTKWPSQVRFCEAATDLENPHLQATHWQQNLGAARELLAVLDPNNDWRTKAWQETDKAFELPPHRLQPVGKINGSCYYDDSISTNQASAQAATNAFKDKLGVIILGGTGETTDFDELFLTLQQEAPQAEVLIVESPLSLVLEQAAKKFSCRFSIVKDLSSAVEHCQQTEQNGRAVVLSPAGKSFYAYKNYQERGDHFAKLVTAKT